MKDKPIKSKFPDRDGRTVLVDFDGTLAEFTENWRYLEIGPPKKDALKLLKLLKQRGYHIMIYSARTDRSCIVRTKAEANLNMEDMQAWLRIHGMMRFIDEIWCGDKPLGVIVDDMAVHANGDVDAMVARVDELQGGGFNPDIESGVKPRGWFDWMMNVCIKSRDRGEV